MKEDFKLDIDERLLSTLYDLSLNILISLKFIGCCDKPTSSSVYLIQKKQKQILYVTNISEEQL